MKWIPWILILPVILIRGFTTLYPIGATLKNSLFDIKVLSGINEFVGLSNYVNVFKDPKIISSISFTVIFVVVSMVFHVVLGVMPFLPYWYCQACSSYPEISMRQQRWMGQTGYRAFSGSRSL